MAFLANEQGRQNLTEVNSELLILVSLLQKQMNKAAKILPK